MYKHKGEEGTIKEIAELLDQRSNTTGIILKALEQEGLLKSTLGAVSNAAGYNGQKLSLYFGISKEGIKFVEDHILIDPELTCIPPPPKNTTF